MDLRPTNGDEKLRFEPYDPKPRVSTSSTRCRHALIFNGVPMGLRPTNGDEKLPAEPHDR